MKALWWVMVAVFFLGIGVGSAITGAQDPADRELPSFSTQIPPAQLNVPQTEPSEPEVEQAGHQDALVAFPCRLQYTSLVVCKLISYDGPYLEDGSGENVMGMAALVLENTGTIGIEYARIVLMQNGQQLVFDATYIPPKSTVLVLEENKTAYSDAPVTQCRCHTVIPGVFDLAQRTVQIREEGMCTLQVTNLTDEEMECVRVFYKHYNPEADMYVGGITYSAVIQNLKPGETRSITPYRYACGYALVVAAVQE